MDTEDIEKRELSSPRSAKSSMVSESGEVTESTSMATRLKRPLEQVEADRSPKRQAAVDELRLKSNIDPSCCVYISNIKSSYPLSAARGFIQNRMKKNDICAVCLVWGTEGDAFLQLASTKEANLAIETLEGSMLVHCPLVAKKWNSKYLASFNRSCHGQRICYGAGKIAKTSGDSKVIIFSPSSRENMRSTNAYSGAGEKGTVDYQAKEDVRRTVQDARRKLDSLRDENQDLRRYLEEEKAYSRKLRRDLEAEVSDLNDDSEYLEEKIRRQTGYEKKLKDTVRRLEYELRRNEGELENQESCMAELRDELANLKEKLGKQQSENTRLVEENHLLRDGQKEAKKTESLLVEAMEENDGLRDQLEQMEMNHALEMGSSQGLSFPDSTVEQKLASAMARIAELECQLKCSRNVKAE
eukprot:scaffold2441_cov105-Cylindrotheca_fusiformis.AAC.11